MSSWTKTGSVRGPTGATGATGATPTYGSLTKVVPTTGQSLTIPDNCANYMMVPAATILTLTLKLPAAPPSYDQTVRIGTTQQITTLTIVANTGQTLAAAYSAILSPGAIGFVYDPSAKIYYRNR